MTEEIVHRAFIFGDWITFTWRPLPFRPPDNEVGRVYGLCFTPDGRMPMVGFPEDEGLYLPGGGVETGESSAEALARELDEEIAARIVRSRYLGSHLAEVDGKPEVDEYHTFYRCDIEFERPFASSTEIAVMELVAPDVFLANLAWSDDPKAKVLLKLALKAAD